MDVTMNDLLTGLSEEKLSEMRPADLLSTMKLLRLRTQLKNKRIPLDATINGSGPLTAEYCLLALRDQFDAFAGRFSEALQRRLRYFYQFQLAPSSTRRIMSDSMALTYMPSNGHQCFPHDTRFWDIQGLDVLTLNVRLNRTVARNTGKVFTIDHFDFRSLWAAEQPEEAKIKLGGSVVEEGGSAYSRVELSRMMDFEPGRDRWAIPSDRPVMVDQAISMHAAMEYAIATGQPQQATPVLPAIYFAFSPSEPPDLEVTEPLKAQAFRNVQNWLKSGKPMSDDYNWTQPFRASFNDSIDPDRLTGWSDIESLIGDSATYTLAHTWAENEVPYNEDLFLLPATIFSPDSKQEPFKTARGIFVDLEPYLGRQTIHANGGGTVDDKLCDIQIIRLPIAETPPKGVQGHWEYDFTSVESGMEQEFI